MRFAAIKSKIIKNATVMRGILFKSLTMAMQALIMFSAGILKNRVNETI